MSKLRKMASVEPRDPAALVARRGCPLLSTCAATMAWHVLPHLTLRELFALFRVCRDARSLASEPGLWKALHSLYAHLGKGWDNRPGAPPWPYAPMPRLLFAADSRSATRQSFLAACALPCRGCRGKYQGRFATAFLCTACCARDRPDIFIAKPVTRADLRLALLRAVWTPAAHLVSRADEFLGSPRAAADLCPAALGQWARREKLVLTPDGRSYLLTRVLALRGGDGTVDLYDIDDDPDLPAPIPVAAPCLSDEWATELDAAVWPSPVDWSGGPDSGAYGILSFPACLDSKHGCHISGLDLCRVSGINSLRVDAFCAKVMEAAGIPNL